jgi:DNA-binding NarL/FixJ family response regulator
MIQLTEQELDVMKLVAGGVTRKQIASTLFIARSTVDYHIRGAMLKSGCRNSIQTVARLIESGTIDTKLSLEGKKTMHTDRPTC